VSDRFSAVLAASWVLPELLRHGGGAGVQRAIYEIAGIDGVVRHLTELTAAEAFLVDVE
jgi:hypothetical protein